jgi:poly-gamma-glutamate system protein
MKDLPLHTRLSLVFAVLLAGTLLVHLYFTSSIPLEEAGRMEQAASLAREWFAIIGNEKDARGILSDALTRVPNAGMIGDDFTFLTTTLGSLGAKEISANPDFAALVVRLLHEAGAFEGDRVGLIVSGSFPALAVSTLAALQVMDMEVVMLSSLGASAYGANQPGATWIDMENWLIREGGLRYRSVLVSPGAENDRGDGLTKEGMDMILDAAARNRQELYMPEDLLISIRHKTGVFRQEHIRVLINIGGNQAALGRCSHASSLPNGLNQELRNCGHPDRGIIREINARGIPVIHLLNIRELASEYGIDTAPGWHYAESVYLYSKKESRRGPLAVTLCAGIITMAIFLRKHQKQI